MSAFTPTWPTRPDSSPPLPPCRCARWASGTTPGVHPTVSASPDTAGTPHFTQMGRQSPPISRFCLWQNPCTRHPAREHPALTPTWPTHPDSSPPSPPCRCARWASGTTPGVHPTVSASPDTAGTPHFTQMGRQSPPISRFCLWQNPCTRHPAREHPALTPTWPTHPDSSPPSPPCRCARWASGTAPGAPAAFPPGRPG